MGDTKAPVVLIICDGWGVGKTDPQGIESEGNAVAMANTPVRDELLRTQPWSLLETCGEAVGLPAGQMGNSEVGHLNLGAGRIVYQNVTRISKAISEGTFTQLTPLSDLAAELKQTGGALHLMGLVSDGGVHSEITHLWALMDWADSAGLPIRIHCFTDGRDTSPTSGLQWIEQAKQRAGSLGDAAISTVVGRYYAMDRDRRWARMEPAFQAIANGQGSTTDDPVAYVESQYANGITDEFLEPVVVSGSQGIGPDDGVIFFNFRADRARQLTQALTDPDFKEFDRGQVRVDRLVTMTQYEDDAPFPVLFPPQPLKNVLGDVLDSHGLTQLRTAETEKYPHVTYFFNGGLEEPGEHERRALVASPKVATYDLKPDMSAEELTENLLTTLRDAPPDFVLINFANPDMVGHTGSIPAAVKAVEFVDECVGHILQGVQRLGGTALVTADHGNAEKMLAEDGSPFTAHTLYPVHFIYVPPAPDGKTVRDGVLADVAPTVLECLGVAQPVEMTGRSLLAAEA